MRAEMNVWIREMVKLWKCTSKETYNVALIVEKLSNVFWDGLGMYIGGQKLILYYILKGKELGEVETRRDI